MLDSLCQLAQLLRRVPQRSDLPHPDHDLLNDVVEGLQDAWQAEGQLRSELGALAQTSPDDSEAVVRILIRIHLLLDALNTPLLDLHEEVKRLIAESPQIEE